MSGLFVAIETGGTKILCRVVEATGAVRSEVRLATTSPADAARDLIGAIEAARSGAVIAGIGIASFGPVIVDPASPDYGAIQATPKPGWQGFNLVRTLRERFDCPVAIDTDVNLAARAEQASGAGAGCRAVAYVTVGTGIGGGFVVDGRPLNGALHPEIGHLPLLRLPGDDHPSTCPFHTDCAEGLAAGPALRARLGPHLALEEAPQVRALLADYIGQLAASLVLAWSPDRIVLGGGVMAAGDMIEDIARRMRDRLNGYAAFADGPGYVVAAALENAGLEGALLLARAARP